MSKIGVMEFLGDPMNKPDVCFFPCKIKFASVMYIFFTQ